MLLGGVAVAVATSVLEAISGSADRAASDGPAIEAVLRAEALLPVLGAAAPAAVLRRGVRA
ncbi:hypothetical protein ACFWUZ_23650 [Streptomyces sp. NPDC058646]|uniref:hypothetical protein n=1 Tax=Streptomyces sp. NPDC058646 TaxID=3346574 RepID=UPI003647BA39